MNLDWMCQVFVLKKFQLLCEMVSYTLTVVQLMWLHYMYGTLKSKMLQSDLF